MPIYVANIEEATLENENFRKVLNTASHSQLVLMTLQPGEDIGLEVHSDIDQFIRVEQGEGIALLDGVEYAIKGGSAIVIPAGVQHNITNTSLDKMKLYTIYSPPEHKDGVLHATKEDAQSDTSDHFEG
jgi:mannose-6-phosphate isomerase-like protein (cupin superfamily)